MNPTAAWVDVQVPAPYPHKPDEVRHAAFRVKRRSEGLKAIETWIAEPVPAGMVLVGCDMPEGFAGYSIEGPMPVQGKCLSESQRQGIPVVQS